jgi:short-subunit dehydrogenase
MDLKNKVAIVTGASAGIGMALARLLSQNGVRVALAARSAKKLKSLASELPGSLPLPTDMTKESDILKMVSTTHAHYGRIDILINNAGQGYDAPIETTDIQTFHNIFELDMIGPLIAMQQVIPIMRAQGGGTIVNISSGTALMYLPNMGAYSSLKRSLANLSLTARSELEKDKIAVTVVYPYITLTDFELNTIKDTVEEEWEDDGEGSYQPPDTPEFISQKIVEGIQNGEAEIFAHDWMKKSS